MHTCYTKRVNFEYERKEVFNNERCVKKEEK